jgi:hypothetical protein
MPYDSEKYIWIINILSETRPKMAADFAHACVMRTEETHTNRFFKHKPFTGQPLNTSLTIEDSSFDNKVNFF